MDFRSFIHFNLREYRNTAPFAPSYEIDNYVNKIGIRKLFKFDTFLDFSMDECVVLPLKRILTLLDIMHVSVEIYEEYMNIEQSEYVNIILTHSEL